MIYDYKCSSCGEEFIIMKSIHEYASEPEPCPKCTSMASRYFKPPHTAVVRDFEADYYPSLGKVMHNRKELRYHLDKHDLVAIGNDFGSGASMQKEFDRKREEARERSWKDLEI